MLNSQKKRAEEVLKRAEDVTRNLEEAAEAQSAARNAITRANDDINLATIDLEQIDEESIDAQKRANETVTQVNSLNDRLLTVQKNALRNDVDAKDVKSRSEQVKDLAVNAHDLASQLKNNYQQANASLTERARKTEGARERAQLLLARASKITVDTSNKLKALQAMNDLYKVNERDLEKLESRVHRLSSDLSIAFNTIQEQSDYYRRCNS